MRMDRSGSGTSGPAQRQRTTRFVLYAVLSGYRTLFGIHAETPSTKWLPDATPTSPSSHSQITALTDHSGGAPSFQIVHSFWAVNALSAALTRDVASCVVRNGAFRSACTSRARASAAAIVFIIFKNSNKYAFSTASLRPMSRSCRSTSSCRFVTAPRRVKIIYGNQYSALKSASTTKASILFLLKGRPERAAPSWTTRQARVQPRHPSRWRSTQPRGTPR